MPYVGRRWIHDARYAVVGSRVGATGPVPPARRLCESCREYWPRPGEGVEQAGESRIAQPRDRVWRALNDPEVLARCLDGCKSLTAVGDGEYEAEVGAKVGPVKATFKAAVAVRDPIEPESYRLVVAVKGGAAGFAKGSALVNLEEVAGDDGDETLLTYQINGNIGGKLAQIGSRLVDAAARKMAARFFQKFAVDFDTA